MRVFNNELHGLITSMSVGYFTLNVGVSHDRRSEDDGDVMWCHLEYVNFGNWKVYVEKGRTRFSDDLRITRARWKIKNSRVSRCLGGRVLIVFLTWEHRSWSSSIARLCQYNEDQGVNGWMTYSLIPKYDHRLHMSVEVLEAFGSIA